VRLQAQRAARLDDDDYGLGDDTGDAMGDAAGDAGAAGGRKGRSEGARGVEVEAVAKDLSALTKGGCWCVRSAFALLMYCLVLVLVGYAPLRLQEAHTPEYVNPCSTTNCQPYKDNQHHNHQTTQQRSAWPRCWRMHRSCCHSFRSCRPHWQRCAWVAAVGVGAWGVSVSG